MLTAEQVDSYKRRGYVVARGVFNQKEIEQLRRVSDEFVERSRSAVDHTEFFDLEPGHSAEKPRLRRLKDPVRAHPVFDAALRHRRLLDIVEQLIGPGIRFNGDKLNMKSGGYGSPVEWHQDWAFYPHTNDDLLAAGVALDDMTLENGCLLMVPGSHQGPVYDHHQDGVFIGAVTDPRFDPDAETIDSIQMRAGSVSLHHVRAVHGSAPNRSSSPRRLLLFQYAAMDAWPLLGIDSWEAFQETILRGEPVWEPRMENVPTRIPLPSPPRVGSIYEIQTQLDDSARLLSSNSGG